jgi:hypothetical protein
MIVADILETFIGYSVLVMIVHSAKGLPVARSQASDSVMHTSSTIGTQSTPHGG